MAERIYSIFIDTVDKKSSFDRSALIRSDSGLGGVQIMHGDKVSLKYPHAFVAPAEQSGETFNVVFDTIVGRVSIEETVARGRTTRLVYLTEARISISDKQEAGTLPFHDTTFPVMSGMTINRNGMESTLE